MWTGEKIIFLEKSVIVPFFKDMSLDTIDHSTDSVSKHCLLLGVRWKLAHTVT